MKNILTKLVSRSFTLEFDSLSAVVPSAKEVCASIQKYAERSRVDVVFTSTEMPVQFYLDDTLYTTVRGTSRGGPTVRCREVTNVK